MPDTEPSDQIGPTLPATADGLPKRDDVATVSEVERSARSASQTPYAALDTDRNATRVASDASQPSFVVADDAPPPLARRRWWPAIVEIIALLAIVTIAVLLRFRGITWASGYYLHPDELHLSSVLDRISMPISFREYLNTQTSPLNPFNQETGYVYGTFPLFMAEWIGSFTDYTAINNNHIPGRWLSALADTGSVVLVWWIGRMLWNRWVGLLAALLLACTVLNIQSAHFFTTDSWSTMFGTAAFAFALAAWKHQRWIFYVLAGLMVGLAGASKPTMLASIGFLALPAFETIRVFGWQAFWPSLPIPVDEETARQPRKTDHFPVLFASILALLVAVWTFRLAQPYTFAGPSLFSFRLDARWLADIQFWQQVQSGEVDYPPSLQWTERAPIIFQLRNLVLWGMGPALGVAALGGLAWIGWRMLKGSSWPSWTLLVPAGWIMFHLVYFGVALSKTMRYILPAYPLLVVFAAGLLGSMVVWGWRRGRVHIGTWTWRVRIPRWCHPGVVMPLLVVASTLLYAVAFSSIYARDHSRVDASQWIVENIPDGSTIASEYWDSGLPVGIPEQAGHFWNGVSIAPYDNEDTDKVTRMVGVLQQSDYVILSSNRLIDSISRLPWRYPMANAYYDALLSGELGFEEVAHFTSYPELFGISIDDREAEEAFTVYDHPEVRIFRKTENWNAHDAWYLLTDALGHGGLSVRPVQTQPDRMMLDVEAQDAVRSADSWSDLFDPDSLMNRLAPVFWYLGLQLLALAAMPLAWRLLPWLPDRGYAVSKTLGLFLVGWVVWWLASPGWLSFGLLTIALGWLLVLAASGLAIRKQERQLVVDLRQRLPWIVATEAVLLAGFVAALVVRSGNPDLWIPDRVGSQLQNMGQLVATVMTPSFPVYDPWLVDGAIHDFALGLVPWAVLTRITSIVPDTAYSLTLASLAALLLLNAWQLTALLISRFRPGGTNAAIVGGLVGILTIGLLGPWGLAQRLGRIDSSPNDEATIRDAFRGLWSALTGGSDVVPGAWWQASTFAGPGTLEVPLLSYLTNELGVQQLGLPLLLAGLAVTVGFLSKPQSDDFADADGRLLASLGGWRATLSWLGVVGVIVGWTVATNFLFGIGLVLVMTLLTLLTSIANATWHQSWPILRDTGIALTLVGAVAIVSIWPFLKVFGTFATQRESVAQALSVQEFAGYVGGALFIGLAWVIFANQESLDHTFRAHGWPRLLSVIPVLLLLAIMVLAWLVGLVVLFGLVLLMAIGLLLWQSARSGWQLALGSFLAVAAVLTILANTFQFASWTDQQNLPRQFSLMMWVLLAIAAAALIVIGTLTLRASRWPIIAIVPPIAGLLLLAPGLVYPLLAIPDQQRDRLVQQSATLDASAFMEEGILDLNAQGGQVAPYALAPDLTAVNWLRATVSGLPTILEAPATTNGWGGRISALTGFPTVLGSVPVETQQRPGMERLVTWRLNDITTIYNSSQPFAEITPLLRDYGVQLIYVGPLERATYSPAGLAKFEDAVGTGELEVVYAADGVSIYFYNGVRDSREPGQ